MPRRATITTKRIVEVDAGITLWNGVCVKDQGVTVLVNVSIDGKSFDGYTIFRTRDISGFRIWSREEYSKIECNNVRNLARLLPLPRMTSLEKSIQVAGEFGLMALFTENQTDHYFVCKLVSLRNQVARFRVVDRTPEFCRYKTIKVKNINFISFGTYYERELEGKLGVCGNDLGH